MDITIKNKSLTRLLYFLIFIIISGLLSIGSVSAVTNIKVSDGAGDCTGNYLETSSEMTCYDNTTSPLSSILTDCTLHFECCNSITGCWKPGYYSDKRAACVISRHDTMPPPFYAQDNQDNIDIFSSHYGTSCIKWQGASEKLSSFRDSCIVTNNGSCPSGYTDFAFEGSDCEIYYRPASDWNNIKANYGKWDTGRQECVTCSGKKINKTCATTGGFFLDASYNCSGSGYSGQFERACNTDIDVACEQKTENQSCQVGASCEKAKGFGGVCAAGDTCDSNGYCKVPAGALVMTATALSTSIPLSGSTEIKFHVEENGSPLSGATVTAPTITSGLGTIAAGTTSPNCLAANTNASGDCYVTYNAPASSTTATINSTKAEKTPKVSGAASATVTVTECVATNFIKFRDSQYNVGDNYRIEWAVSQTEASNYYTACLYDTNSSKTELRNFYHSAGSADISSDYTKVAPQAGTARVVLLRAPGAPPSCPGSPAGCIASVDVITSGPPPPPPCTPSPEVCTDGTDNDCDSLQDCEDTSDCPNDTPCEGASGNFCTNGACVECTATNLANCTANQVCNNGSCEACRGEDVAAASADLCCAGLSWIDGTCTSRCDYRNSFFCNPLRKTVEDIVQGGQKMIGYVLGLVGSIALLFIVIAGMMYMTSAGSEEKIASSKRILTGAIIGITITLLAYSFLQVILSILNMP